MEPLIHSVSGMLSWKYPEIYVSQTIREKRWVVHEPVEVSPVVLGISVSVVEEAIGVN